MTKGQVIFCLLLLKTLKVAVAVNLIEPKGFMSVFLSVFSILNFLQSLIDFYFIFKF